MSLSSASEVQLIAPEALVWTPPQDTRLATLNKPEEPRMERAALVDVANVEGEEVEK